MKKGGIFYRDTCATAVLPVLLPFLAHGRLDVIEFWQQESFTPET
jgi:hypothetical protein